MIKRCLPFTLFFLFFFSLQVTSHAQAPLDSLLPVRGLAIAAPTARNMDSFIVFINKELVPRKVNTMIIRIDFNYQYKSHPELVDDDALSTADVKKLVAASKKAGIRLIPQVNLLGHQSWANETGKLLQAYPQFDETPWVKMPEKYKWPNEDGLYCKSYCPLHPDVHKVVFDVVDEICDVFETDAFHAGMDEVFYLGEDKCPRCGGRDKAELFAGEVRTIRDHLAGKGRALWIWGDRLLDGKTTGIGMWEASYNNTHRAIDMIPKDVVICDWHYERADPTPAYFAMKGFNVIVCPWRKPEVGVQHVNNMVNYRQQATKEMKGRFLGVMETVWAPVSSFLNEYYGKPQPAQNGGTVDTVNTQANTFKAMYNQMQLLEKKK
jgi:hypothetical protein